MYFNLKIGNWLNIGGKRDFSQTPDILPNILGTTNAPEWLAIDDKNAFEIFKSTSELFTVIQRRGQLLSSGTWKHYKQVKGKATEIENSEVVKLLENPNPLMNGNQFLQVWNESLCVYGNDYMLMLKAFQNSLPRVLNHLQPSDIEIKRSGKWYRQTVIEDIIQEYKIISTNDIILPDEIIHSKFQSIENPIKGDSPLTSISQDLSNIRLAKAFRNVVLSKNGALGMLTPKQATTGAIPLTPEERKRIEQQYANDYGIGSKQRKVMIAQTAMDWVAMTYPTKDMLVFEEVTAGFEKIIDLYGMNKHMFSGGKDNTFENVNQGLKMAYQTTVIPDAEEKAMTLSARFGLVEKGEFLEIDYSKIPILQENLKEKAEILDKKANAIAKLKGSGIYNTDEIRNAINLE